MRRASLAVCCALAAAPLAAPSALAQPSPPAHSYVQAPPAVPPYFPIAYPGRRILPSAIVDTAHSTVTRPLHGGRMRDRRSVWYVLTDASDARTARRLGLDYAPKLRNTPDAALRTAYARGAHLVFSRGTVDFSPRRVVRPGRSPAAFPPVEARPGAVGDRGYSPLVRVTNRHDIILNASVVAFDVPASRIEYPDGKVDHDVVTDRAVAISPKAG